MSPPKTGFRLKLDWYLILIIVMAALPGGIVAVVANVRRTLAARAFKGGEQ